LSTVFCAQIGPKKNGLAQARCVVVACRESKENENFFWLQKMIVGYRLSSETLSRLGV